MKEERLMEIIKAKVARGEKLNELDLASMREASKRQSE